jgi:hypothetical protein
VDASLACKNSTVHRDTIKGESSFPIISIADLPSNEFEMNVKGRGCELF